MRPHAKFWIACWRAVSAKPSPELKHTLLPLSRQTNTGHNRTIRSLHQHRETRPTIPQKLGN
jgi:hypothetical protein